MNQNKAEFFVVVLIVQRDNGSSCTGFGCKIAVKKASRKPLTVMQLERRGGTARSLTVPAFWSLAWLASALEEAGSSKGHVIGAHPPLPCTLRTCLQGE